MRKGVQNCLLVVLSTFIARCLFNSSYTVWIISLPWPSHVACTQYVSFCLTAHHQLHFTSSTLINHSHTYHFTPNLLLHLHAITSNPCISTLHYQLHLLCSPKRSPLWTWWIRRVDMTGSHHHLCLFNLSPLLRTSLSPSFTALLLSQDSIFDSFREVCTSRKIPLEPAKRHHKNRKHDSVYVQTKR